MTEDSKKLLIRERQQLEQEWCELRKLQAQYKQLQADAVPMTDEQVIAAFNCDPIAVSRPDFIQGIRYAESYHGISVDAAIAQQKGASHE